MILSWLLSEWVSLKISKVKRTIKILKSKPIWNAIAVLCDSNHYLMVGFALYDVDLLLYDLGFLLYAVGLSYAVVPSLCAVGLSLYAAGLLLYAVGLLLYAVGFLLYAVVRHFTLFLYDHSSLL